MPGITCSLGAFANSLGIQAAPTTSRAVQSFAQAGPTSPRAWRHSVPLCTAVRWRSSKSDSALRWRNLFPEGTTYALNLRMVPRARLACSNQPQQPAPSATAPPRARTWATWALRMRPWARCGRPSGTTSRPWLSAGRSAPHRARSPRVDRRPLRRGGSSGQPGPGVCGPGRGAAGHRLLRAGLGHHPGDRRPPQRGRLSGQPGLGVCGRWARSGAPSGTSRPLAISREIGDRRDEGIHLGNLGLRMRTWARCGRP